MMRSRDIATRRPIYHGWHEQALLRLGHRATGRAWVLAAQLDPADVAALRGGRHRPGGSPDRYTSHAMLQLTDRLVLDTISVRGLVGHWNPTTALALITPDPARWAVRVQQLGRLRAATSVPIRVHHHCISVATVRVRTAITEITTWLHDTVTRTVGSLTPDRDRHPNADGVETS